MTDAERARIIAETEATLERLRDFPSGSPRPDEKPTAVREVPLPEPEDGLTRWRREADEADRRRAEAKACAILMMPKGKRPCGSPTGAFTRSGNRWLPQTTGADYAGS